MIKIHPVNKEEFVKQFTLLKEASRSRRRSGVMSTVRDFLETEIAKGNKQFLADLEEPVRYYRLKSLFKKMGLQETEYASDKTIDEDGRSWAKRIAITISK